jgi:hypothetical protein
MWRLTISATVVVLASLILAMPAGAITYGTPDDGGHPHVGALVAEVDSERFLLCSGTLISDDVFLTASHCTAALEQITGSDRALVTFDDQFDPVDGTFYEGTAVTNPEYNPTPMNDTGDIAVVLLDAAPPIDSPVQLPSLHLLNELNVKNGLKGQEFRNVGYGVAEPQFGPGGPQFPFNGVREVSWSEFRNLQKAWLHLSQNNAAGNSGTCFGDSGGPQFLGDSDLIVSITVTGDAMCLATNKTYRLDTEAARGFLGQYVDLQ